MGIHRKVPISQSCIDGHVDEYIHLTREVYIQKTVN